MYIPICNVFRLSVLEISPMSKQKATSLGSSCVKMLMKDFMSEKVGLLEIAFPWSDGVEQTYLQISLMSLQLDLHLSAVFSHLQRLVFVFSDSQRKNISIISFSWLKMTLGQSLNCRGITRHTMTNQNGVPIYVSLDQIFPRMLRQHHKHFANFGRNIPGKLWENEVSGRFIVRLISI